MSRSHGHRFANEALPETLFDNPLAFARTLATQRQGLQLLVSTWDRAGALLPAADRVSRSGLTATVEQRGAFVVMQIVVPPPREVGDPAAIVIVGSGDGVTTFDAVQYFILELDVHTATGDTRFVVVSRNARDEHGTPLGDGPPPDTRWFADHVCELVARRAPPGPRIPVVPAWYWWHVFRGAEAMRAFLSANDLASQLQIVQRAPVLMLPELADAADVFLTGGATSQSLRQFQGQLRGDPSFGPACHVLATMLANARAGSPAANLARAIAILGEASEYGADRAQSSAIEADVRQRLAAIGVDVRANHEAAQRLRAAAGPPQQQPGRRIARGSSAGTHGTDDPTWSSVFLDESELPQYQRSEDRRAEAPPPGALHAGYVAWVGHESWPMWRIVDARWLFPTAEAADHFLRSATPAIGDGLPALHVSQLGDATLAFGGATPGRLPNTRHASQIVVVRVGRMIAKLFVAEGPAAPQTGHALDPSMPLPLAQRAAQRAQWMLARYWLSVGRGADAAALFAQSPSPRLLAEYPILALPELTTAMLTLGDAYAPAAQALWQLQTQLRGQQWQAHRDATRALVRTLLDDRASEPRVNAAYAFTLVAEMRRLDADPIWAQLEAECRAVHGT